MGVAGSQNIIKVAQGSGAGDAWADLVLGMCVEQIRRDVFEAMAEEDLLEGLPV